MRDFSPNQRQPASTYPSSSPSKSTNNQQSPSNRRPALFIVLSGFLSILLFTTSGGSAQAPEWTPAWININDPIHANQLDPSIAEASPVELKSSSNALLDFVNNAFSSVSQSISRSSANMEEWVTIFSDDFEGTFPGEWEVSDGDGTDFGEYFWAKSICNPY